MITSTNSQTNRLLGYPANAPLLIISADDFLTSQRAKDVIEEEGIILLDFSK